jgi:hypothetical protein
MPEPVKARTAGLPEGIRNPLHLLSADAAYLVGRVVADGSFGNAAVIEIRDRCERIENAVLRCLASHDAMKEALRKIAGGFEGEGLEIENQWRIETARAALKEAEGERS